jgi:ribosomal protein L11 methyltransferase
VSHLQLAFELGALDADGAERACFACGASAVSFSDMRDDAVLEPGPGEVRLWPATRVTALFVDCGEPVALAATLAGAVGIPAAGITVEALAERVWEREWMRDFHAMRFGERLWVCPPHERVTAPAAAVVRLEPGLAFGTGTHPSTALCLEWLDAHADLLRAPATVIDYGCGSGILALACAKLGARAVHCFDIDPQALIATRDNALANDVADRLRIHARAADLPAGVDVLLANILSGPLCALAPAFAALVRPGGAVVLAGLMRHQAAEVTAAYGTCFDVSGCGERGDWSCLQARRH